MSVGQEILCAAHRKSSSPLPVDARVHPCSRKNSTGLSSPSQRTLYVGRARKPSPCFSEVLPRWPATQRTLVCIRPIVYTRRRKKRGKIQIESQSRCRVCRRSVFLGWERRRRVQEPPHEERRYTIVIEFVLCGWRVVLLSASLCDPAREPERTMLRPGCGYPVLLH